MKHAELHDSITTTTEWAKLSENVKTEMSSVYWFQSCICTVFPQAQQFLSDFEAEILINLLDTQRLINPSESRYIHVS